MYRISSWIFKLLLKWMNGDHHHTMCFFGPIPRARWTLSELRNRYRSCASSLIVTTRLSTKLCWSQGYQRRGYYTILSTKCMQLSTEWINNEWTKVERLVQSEWYRNFSTQIVISFTSNVFSMPCNRYLRALLVYLSAKRL